MKFKGHQFVVVPGNDKLTICITCYSKCSDKFSCTWLFALVTQDIQQVCLLFYYFVNRMAEYSAALNTVGKWEKVMIKCSLCNKFKGDLNKMHSYTSTWVAGKYCNVVCKKAAVLTVNGLNMIYMHQLNKKSEIGK